jgi:hypothetical protein
MARVNNMPAIQLPDSQQEIQNNEMKDEAVFIRSLLVLHPSGSTRGGPNARSWLIVTKASHYFQKNNINES